MVRTIFMIRWTVNLALRTANEFFKSSSSFDASDLAQVDRNTVLLSIIEMLWAYFMSSRHDS